MYRHRHQDTSPLSWDITLQQSAQAYAAVLAQTEDFKHSTNRVNTGENLYFASNTGGVTSEGKCNNALDLWLVLRPPDFLFDTYNTRISFTSEIESYEK